MLASRAPCFWGYNRFAQVEAKHKILQSNHVLSGETCVHGFSPRNQIEAKLLILQAKRVLGREKERKNVNPNTLLVTEI